MVKRAVTGRKGAAWQVRPRWRITDAGRIALGPGKADLLEAIDRTGAISRAAGDMGMSYRRAWMLVAEMNACFIEPLVETSRWRGEGASLSRLGRRVLNLYRLLEARSLTAGRGPIRQLRALVRAPAVRRARKESRAGTGQK